MKYYVMIIAAFAAFVLGGCGTLTDTTHITNKTTLAAATPVKTTVTAPDGTVTVAEMTQPAGTVIETETEGSTGKFDELVANFGNTVAALAKNSGDNKCALAIWRNVWAGGMGYSPKTNQFGVIVYQKDVGFAVIPGADNAYTFTHAPTMVTAMRSSSSAVGITGISHGTGDSSASTSSSGTSSSSGSASSSSTGSTSTTGTTATTTTTTDATTTSN